MKNFSIFRESQGMEEKEQIRKLEAEINRLSAQLAQQQQELWLLQKEVRKLNPNHPAEKETGTYVNASQPTYFSSLQSSSLENLIGLRLIHLIGIVVLVIGLSLGVKYAIDKNLVSEGMRIILAYLAGALLYFFSVRLRKAYTGFSAILLSGAMASIYFTTYGACVYYHFLSYTASFIIMVALTIFTTYQALLYNRQEIALLGLVGAYGIPFLISPNRGNPELLFLYITIINTGVLFICAKRPWVVVGRAAQAISWLLFIGWASWQHDTSIKSYGPVFMSLFFILFQMNSLSAKIFRKSALSLSDTYQVVTNNLAFYIAAQLVFADTFEDSKIALLSFVFSIFSAGQALLFYLWKEKTTANRLSYLALLLFIAFIGYQWDGITVTLLWLLTAVLLFIAGVKLKSIATRMAAILLMGITLLKLVAFDSMTFSTLQKVIAYLVLGILLLLVSYFYQKFKQQLFGD